MSEEHLIVELFAACSGKEADAALRAMGIEPKEDFEEGILEVCHRKMPVGKTYSSRLGEGIRVELFSAGTDRHGLELDLQRDCGGQSFSWYSGKELKGQVTAEFIHVLSQQCGVNFILRTYHWYDGIDRP